jgi:hypothetical protein
MAKQVRPDLATFEIRDEYSVDATRLQSREASFTHAQGKLPKVITITHQHVECVELHLVIVLATMEPIEV